uniref:Uncharacterized protein n=1 Tax=Zooxanthella nutricula TaxID=1333877 RepID=A0A6U9IMW2_9DINO|mmetsp:Transcript_55792/g.169818  ORF Transcript_55792/g.169818 Transcript_55792/m.169818 type:complete len:278 (+) Transcript_55792:96-929(+)
MAPGEAWAVVAAFALMALSNGLAMRKAFGGKDNKQISDENPTYVTPDGATFSIWGFIYLFEMLLVMAQLYPSESANGLLASRCPLTGLKVRERLVLVFCLNGVWLPVFNNERFWAALAIMATYLAVLLSVYSDVNAGTTEGALETVAFATGIAMNTSWIVVALLVTVFFCGALVGWKDQHGVAGSVLAAIGAAATVAAIGWDRVMRGGDFAWAFAAAWALRGIFRMQTIPDKARFPISAMSKNLGHTARVGSWVVVAGMAAKALSCIVQDRSPVGGA